MEVEKILELLKAERDLLSQAIDALQKIASEDHEPLTLRGKMMTNATDILEMRGRGVIPPNRNLARYDEMLRMYDQGDRCALRLIEAARSSTTTRQAP